MRTIAKTDSNQSEIVQMFRKHGAFVLLTHQLKNAFDILVFYEGKIHVCEIKDGTLPPSKRKLTDGELKFKTAIEEQGCTYNIIEDLDDALAILYLHHSKSK